MNPGIDGVLDSVPANVDIVEVGSGQPADGGIFDDRRNGLNCLQVAGRRTGKSRFDDIHAQPFELLGDLHLVVDGESDSGALLAVSQGGVENKYLIHLVSSAD